MQNIFFLFQINSIFLKYKYLNIQGKINLIFYAFIFIPLDIDIFWSIRPAKYTLKYEIDFKMEHKSKQDEIKRNQLKDQQFHN